MNKKIYVILITVVLLAVNLRSIAQVYNNGVSIFVGDNALLYVEDAYIHKDGSISNNGEIIINGDWKNTSTNNVFDLSSYGNVKFIKNGAQLIGNNVTSFPKLQFVGNGVSYVNNSIEIRLRLDLGNQEIVLNNAAMSLINTDENALSRTLGYLNTDNNGAFNRKTNNQNGNYLFPMGSSVLGKYRPVSIKPKDNSNNEFSVALISKEAGLDGYDRQSKRNDIKDINDKYYYKLAQNGGFSASDITFYGSTKDGNFNSIVTWIENRIWDKNAPVQIKNNNFNEGLDVALSYSANALQNGSQVPVNLAEIKDPFNPLTVFTAFSPDGDGKNDKWFIKNIDAFPDNDVHIFDRAGNSVYKVSPYKNENAWDGGNLASGVYYYILRVNVNGTDKVYKGAITMVK